MVRRLATRVRGVTSWRVVSALLALVLVFGLNGRVDLAYLQAPLWVVLVSLAGLFVASSNLPIALWVFWLFGVASLAWSLGPGDTLVASVWEAAQLAAFAGGGFTLPLFVALGGVVLDGFMDVTALSMFGLQQYLSGSVHYVTGAMGAALLVPALWFAGTPARPFVVRVLAAIVGSVGLVVALASGSRAVYLAVVLAVVVAAAQLARPRYRPSAKGVALGAVTACLLAVGIELASGRTLITPAWQTKVTADATSSAVQEYGVLTQRLRLWEQGVRTGFEYPLGTGVGTYRSTSHAFQRYPMLWSSSPHNYAVETLATGGWPRLALLVIVAVVAIWRGLNSERWAWAAAAIALGTTLMFDVTAGYPRVTTMFFLLLGGSYFGGTGANRTTRHTRANWSSRQRVGLGLLSAATLLAVGLWWYLPCSGTMCSVDRYLGHREEAVPALTSASPDETREILERLEELYPRSLWVTQLRLAYAADLDERLAVAREIATTYPFQHPDNYEAWAEYALEAGQPDEARRAITAGLEVFSADTYPYGEARISPEQYQAWLDRAQEILDSVDAAP